MSAARPWSGPSSYAAFRATAWAKAFARNLIDTAVGLMPGPAFRLAAYVQSLERARASSTCRAALPAQGPRPRFEDLLGMADATLDHQTILKLLKSSGDLTEAAYHRYLTTAFVARRIDLVEQVIADGGIGFGDTDLFHSLMLEQYRGKTDRSPADIVAAYHKLSGNPLHRNAAANLAADLIARSGHLADLTAFLDSLPPEHLTRLSAPTFLGCLRLLAGADAKGRVAWLRRAFLDALPPEQQLYFLDVLPPRDQAKLLGAPLTASSVLDRFASLYSAQDAQDYQRFQRCVIDPLRVPAGPRSLMNIRFDADERRQLLASLASALQTGRGLGLVRLGDGEAYGYDHAGLAIAPDAAFIEDNETRERMWWGRTLNETARAELRRRFRVAVATADIIGIPSVYRMIRDRGAAGSPFGLTGGQRGLAVVLAKLGTDIPLTDRLLTEERCHQILFTRDTLEHLSLTAKRVVLVSCWRAGQIALTTPVPVHEIVIPAHTRVAKATGLDPGAPALFETFDAQIAVMTALCEPGTLVLVGAGFLGKIFISAAREKGAVALDVGAMLDYLAGYKTRSLADLG